MLAPKSMKAGRSLACMEALGRNAPYRRKATSGAAVVDAVNPLNPFLHDQTLRDDDHTNPMEMTYTIQIFFTASHVCFQTN